MLLNLECASASPRKCVRTQLLASTSTVSDLASLEQSSVICVSRTFPDDSDGDGPGSPL